MRVLGPVPSRAWLRLRRFASASSRRIFSTARSIRSIWAKVMPRSRRPSFGSHGIRFGFGLRGRPMPE